MVDGSAGATEPFPLFSIVRVAIRSDGAYGVLLHGGLPFAVTLEKTYQPLSGIGRQEVKIPVGRHRCVSTFYYKGGYSTYEIMVPGHSRLLFHKGNIEAHSEGCVLVGESFASIAGTPGIASSAVGFAEFYERARALPGFDLDVRDCS